jgi:phage recombination protein Bet
MNAITKHESALPALAMSEGDLIEVLSTSLYPGANNNSIKMVLGYCRASGLDPMQKPVHIVPMWDSKAKQMRDVIMPGIGLYRTQAARTGCAGVTEPEFGPDVTESLGGQQITFPAWCRVTVKRRLATGEVVDFTAKELWKENYAVKGGQEKSNAPNAMWTKRPYGQLAKCAEAQALRKAFPEIGSEPTADEMIGKTLNEYAGDTIPGYTEEEFKNFIPVWQKVVNKGKTVGDVLSTVKTVATLTPEQEAFILSLKKQEPKVEPAPTIDSEDPFVKALD